MLKYWVDRNFARAAADSVSLPVSDELTFHNDVPYTAAMAYRFLYNHPFVSNPHDLLLFRNRYEIIPQ
jgi:hypothetical protein